MPTCAEIFQSMPTRFQPASAGNWETLIQFNISGEGGGNWQLEVKGGKCEVKDGNAGPSAKATVSTDANTWVGINTNTVNPMTAFMTGKIKVQGNMGELMKLNNPSIFKKPT